MVVFMPANGQVQRLMIQFVEEVTAQDKRKPSFHNPGRAVERPFQHFQANKAACVPVSGIQHQRTFALNGFNKPPKEERVHSRDHVGQEEQDINQHILPLFLSGILPSRAEQGEVGILHECMLR